MMLDTIERNINSKFFIEMLRKNWENNHSLKSIGDLIGELYTHCIINKDGYGFENYMTQIESLYSEYSKRNISSEQLQLQKSKLISVVIASKLGIDVNNVSENDKLRVKNYFLQEYVANGYVSHSFPEAYYESIMASGLVSSTDDRQDKPLDVQEIQNIFMSKGVVAPMGAYPFYGGSGIYYEHDFTKMFTHAVDSPEWFNWFTSADHTTTYHDSVEISPYILRSEVDCRRNVTDLCRNANLSEDETKRVMDFYQKNYSKFSSPKLNAALIPKIIVGKDSITSAVPSDMDLFSTITYVLNDCTRQYTEHDGNVYKGTIPSSEFRVSVIPSASEYIKAGQYQRETQEHLTSPENNLAILQNAENNSHRLVPSMVSKVEKAKQVVLEQKKVSGEQTTMSVGETEQLKSSIESSSSKISFDRRSQSEIQIAGQIREKNRMIAVQKQMKKSQDKVKVLTKKNPNGNPSSSGFVSTLVLTLVIATLVIAMLLITYMIVK